MFLISDDDDDDDDDGSVQEEELDLDWDESDGKILYNSFEGYFHSFLLYIFKKFKTYDVH